MIVNRFNKFGPGFLETDIIEEFKDERMASNKYDQSDLGSLKMAVMD